MVLNPGDGTAGAAGWITLCVIGLAISVATVWLAICDGSAAATTVGTTGATAVGAAGAGSGTTGLDTGRTTGVVGTVSGAGRLDNVVGKAAICVTDAGVFADGPSATGLAMDGTCWRKSTGTRSGSTGPTRLATRPVDACATPDVGGDTVLGGVVDGTGWRTMTGGKLAI